MSRAATSARTGPGAAGPRSGAPGAPETARVPPEEVRRLVRSYRFAIGLAVLGVGFLAVGLVAVVRDRSASWSLWPSAIGLLLMLAATLLLRRVSRRLRALAATT